MKPLACVRHQATAPLGVLQGVFDGAGVPWRYVDPWAGDALPDPSELSGLLVLGGEMNVDELDRHPYLGSLRGLVREAVDRGKPVLGICLGAQVLARAMGASVHRMAEREIGFRVVTATEPGSSDSLLAPFSPRARVFQFHEDACELPAGAELLFRGEGSAVQAFRVGDRAYGVQFHFEVTRAEIEAWCDETPDLAESWGVTKGELMRQAGSYLEAQQRAGREVAARFVSLLDHARV